MKIKMDNSVVTIVSETKKEVMAMLQFYYGGKLETTTSRPVKVADTKEDGRSKRKYRHKQECDICGLKFKGLKVHKKLKHEGQKSVLMRYNDRRHQETTGKSHPDLIDSLT